DVCSSDLVLQGQGGIEDRADETTAAIAFQTEPTRHRGLPEIGVDDQHTRLGGLRERARQVDRRQRLAVARPRARHGYDREVRGLVQMLDPELERPVLLGPERGRRQQADQMPVYVGNGGERGRADRRLLRRRRFPVLRESLFLFLLSPKDRRRRGERLDGRSDRLGGRSDRDLWRRRS